MLDAATQKLANQRVGEFRLSINAAKLLDELEGTLAAGQFRAVKHELRRIPETMRKAYLEAVAGRSLRQGVKTLCMDCSKWNRGRVRRCDERQCPIWPYRAWRNEEVSP